MQIKFFFIPMIESAQAESELNAFLKQFKIGNVERVFFPGNSPGWSVCVEYFAAAQDAPKRGSESVDYKEVLDEETFKVYSALRSWRNLRAEELGIQRYAIASNEQLACIAKQKPKTLSELSKIESFGPTRLKKYGDNLIEVCGVEVAKSDGDGRTR